MTCSYIKTLRFSHSGVHLILRTKSNYFPVSTNRRSLQWSGFVLIV